MNVSDEWPETTVARLAWEDAWQACADLKKKHQPFESPVELWTPLAAACDAAYKKWMALRAAQRKKA